MRIFEKTRLFLQSEWFIIGMLGCVVLASIYPNLGASGGPIHADFLGTAGIFFIFLFCGLGISPESLRLGFSRWKIHLTVQSTTYILFPLLWWVFYLLCKDYISQDLMLGFLYLCALPSTISSSVAMTAVARGNVAAAIFNASFSSLLGIFLTPLIVSLAIRAQGVDLPILDAMLNIAGLLLLPFLLGQLLRPRFGARYQHYKKYTAIGDKLVILLLVLNAFSDSVRGGLWTEYGMELLVQTFVITSILLLIALQFTRACSRWLGFNIEDEIATIFCGSKKTLASGVPMAKLLFGASPSLGLIVLPIMFYHQIQLFVCAIMAEKYARRDD